MIILNEKISIGQLSALAENLYGDMIKAVADVPGRITEVAMWKIHRLGDR